MELNPSTEAASCAAIQELPNILWNPKVCYLVRKSPLLVSYSQLNLVHTASSNIQYAFFFTVPAAHRILDRIILIILCKE
jgi:hypothetical protein